MSSTSARLVPHFSLSRYLTDSDSFLFGYFSHLRMAPDSCIVLVRLVHGLLLASPESDLPVVVDMY